MYNINGGTDLCIILGSSFYRLEHCGFKVMGVTADGLSVNQHFFKLYEDNTTDTLVTSEDRCLYVFSDPPHLIKTV